jgi:anti-sigma regulatory factor (Ser/Thr protein kinase)
VPRRKPPRRPQRAVRDILENLMNLIGVISSDTEINDEIQSEFDASYADRYILRFPEESEILEFLNFDLPEIVIINFSDTQIDTLSIIEQVRDDSWLHNFGIIGLYNPESDSEEDMLQQLKNVNILALLNFHRVKSHITKSVQIVDDNRQIIFQNELSSKLFDRASGSFAIENDVLASSIYASIAATTLAQRGYINPETKMLLQLALAELLINAIEHGNCGISYEEKSQFLEDGLSVVDLVQEKCRDPLIEAKRVEFEYDISPHSTRFVIRDQGEGFDVQALSEKLKTEGEMSLHGRGIRMAAALAEKLSYNKRGNEVSIVFPHDEVVSRDTPAGFADQEAVIVKKDDIVFREGETSNFLYYISSGSYSVFHKSQHIGMISPGDIFMGEMSFLLNNRRSATVRAEGPGKLIRISRKAFVSVIKDYPHYGIFLSKLLARKLVRTNLRNAMMQQQQQTAE